MENLNIEQFNPTVIELTKMAEEYKNLSIVNVEDREGYNRVHEARMKLVRTRIDITKKGKELREDANKFSKAVIAREKELVGLIEPVEKELERKQEEIDNEKERIKRVTLIPERIQKLLEIGESVPEKELLDMSIDDFSKFYNDRKEAYLLRKEEEQKAEQAKIALEIARKEAEILAERNRIEEEKRKIEEEKNREFQEKERQLQLEIARKEAEERGKRLEAERIEREKNEKEEKEIKERAEIEKKEKYQAFLEYHGANSENFDECFYTVRKNNQIILYKRLGSFDI